jgi:3',5'-cyclic AMP phosphodiesterase CpdA
MHAMSRLGCLIACLLIHHAVPAASVTVFAAGDIADCRTMSAATGDAAHTAAMIAPMIKGDPQARVLTLGDSTYPNGTLAEFTDCYAPTWGQFKDRTHPAPGNVEYVTPQAAGYFDYFGKAAGPDRRGYYRVKLGDWQVYSLSSSLDPQQHAAQLAWLKTELAAHPAACSMAYWHHPLLVAGKWGSLRMGDVWQALQAARVDVVLTGHAHLYARFAPQDSTARVDTANGITQFVVGTGGAELFSLDDRMPNVLFTRADHFGVLKLKLHADRYEWDFLSLDPAAPHDSGTLACH